MARRHDHNASHLTIELETELRTRIENAAAERDMSMRDYVVAALRAALDSNGTPSRSTAPDEWSRLSVPSFARDWDSDADAIYDDLA